MRALWLPVRAIAGGRGGMLVAFVCLLLVATGLPSPAGAGVPITLYRSFAGNLDFVGTAGSLRVGNCGVTSSGSGSLSGVPAGATIRAAYLYWAKSGAAPDTLVTFSTPAQSNLAVSADRTFDESYVSGGTTYSFFSGFADVTSEVQAGGNGLYTLSNLSFSTGPPYSNVAVCLGGWGLIVIYDDPSEPLRVVNVFDGFQNFRGSQITLTPDNFVIPPSPIDGRLGHVTWEGDVGNSGALNGFQEQLRFEGSVLSDVDNPSNNQFNSRSNVTTPTSTPPGVDVDSYVLGPPLLSAGQTSASTVFSSGGDRVLLSAEVFAVTNTPVADLAITKSASGDFAAGQVETWTLAVANNGPIDEPGPIQVTDVLPAGTSFDAATGVGWSCSEASGTVSCSHPGPLAAGASLRAIALDVLVDPTAAPSVVNTATVVGTLFDNVGANDSATITTNVLLPDLSSSTKSVVDLNGGDAEPGDRLEYTISLVESNGATATARVTDDVPANGVGASVVSLPPGATDASSGPPTGANGTGLVDVQDIVVPASGSVDVVFEVTIAPAATPGTVIANTATITPSVGTGGNPSAPDVIVSQSQVPAQGTKELYLGNPAATPSRALARTAPNGLPPTSTLGNVVIDRNESETWTLTPPLAAPLSLSGADFPVVLWLRKGGTNGGAANRRLRIDVASTSLGLIARREQTIAIPGAPTEFTFDLSPGASLPATLPAGDVVTLSVTNISPGSNNRRLRVFPAVAGAGNSRVELDATTVVNVDSVDGYDAAYPGGAIPATFAPGQAVSLRALVSDPFGAFDISAASLEVVDATGATVVGPVAMNELAAAQTASTKTFEHLFTLDSAAAIGTWTARVTASEGDEGTISDLGLGTFVVANAADVVIWKTVSVLDDPVNGSTNPKAIPGANVVYTIGISNQGPGATDVDSVLIVDPLPAELELYVANFGNRGPLAFVDGATPSGVDVVFGGLADEFDDIDFDDGSGSWLLEPSADAEGFDASVTAIRIHPTGALQGSSGTPPSFEIRFRARVE